MISNEIIKFASNTSNVGLTNKYTFKSTKKNSMCGDLIKVELILKNSKISSMKYETESCVLCEASMLHIIHMIPFHTCLLYTSPSPRDS